MHVSEKSNSISLWIQSQFLRYFFSFWGTLYYLLPRKIQVLWARCIGKVFSICKYRRSVILENLNRAFPEDSKREIQNKIENFYLHFGFLILEIAMLFGPMGEFCKRKVKFFGREHLIKAKNKGKPCMYLVSHLGNWEVMTAKACLEGVPLLMVTKQLKPSALHVAFEEARARWGVRATYEPRTMRDILSHLRVAGNGVGMILDQYMGPPFSVKVPFFGVPVGTSVAFATIAKRVNAEILPCLNIRNQETGEFEVHVHPALDYDQEESLERVTARCTEWIENQIKLHPEQWLWSHRRFKGDLSSLDKPL